MKPIREVWARFVACYLVLYCLPSPFDEIPGLSALADDYRAAWRAVVPWLATHVLRMEGPVSTAFTGSGDTLFKYLWALCLLPVASLLAATWPYFARTRFGRGLDSKKAKGWMHTYLAIVLASEMIGYGMAKIFPGQFPAPGFSRLLESYGNSSPMALLWTFMGASRGYSVFAGVAEGLGGVLLLLPGLRTLGALVCFGVMSNVFAMNLFYDVSVKLKSFHLLVIALFLLLPGARRLFDAFVLNRRVEPAPTVELLKGPRANRALSVAQVALAAVFAASAAYSELGRLHERADEAASVEDYGIWQVEEPGDWKRVVFEVPGRLTVQKSDGALVFFALKRDGAGKYMTLESPHHAFAPTRFAVRAAGSGQMALSRVGQGRPLTMRLRKCDPSFLLVDRGFHLVNERPFNR